MEEGEGAGLERVTIIEDENVKKNVPKTPPMDGIVPPADQSVSVQTGVETASQSEVTNDGIAEDKEEAPQPTFIKRQSTVVHNESEDH